MSYFYLPRVYGYLSLKKNIEYSHDEIIPNTNLTCYLNKIKNEKDEINEKWKKIKRRCFPYYILNSSKNSIMFNKYIPYHRKFFVYIEIINTMMILQNFSTSKQILIYCTGDYCISIYESYLYLQKNNIVFHCDNTEQWKNENLKISQKNLILLNDIKNNILDKTLLTKIFTKYKKYFHILNCDIKFKNYENNEKREQKLTLECYIYLNILYCLMMQRDGGYLILKLPNIFNKIYQQILYFLSTMYEKVIVMKPQICKNINSEKYIICKNLIVNYDSYTLYELISRYIASFRENKNKYIKNILESELPLFFINKLDECNAILGQQQLEVMASLLNTCILETTDNSDRIEIIETKVHDKCVNWCYLNNFNLN